MKSTFVSTAAISQAMRYSLMRAQSELTKAQKEVSTGHFADIGLALGSRTGQSVSFERDLERHEGHRRFERARLGAADVDAGRADPDFRRGPELPVDAHHQRFGRRHRHR